MCPSLRVSRTYIRSQNAAHISHSNSYIHGRLIYATHILIHLNTKKHIMFLQSLQEINIYRFPIDLRLHFADSANKIFNLSCSKERISEQNSKYITEYRFKSQYKIKKFFTLAASNIYFPILLELTINHEILLFFYIQGIPKTLTANLSCDSTYTYLHKVHLQSNIRITFPPSST